jgi:hypothetical protein
MAQSFTNLMPPGSILAQMSQNATNMLSALTDLNTTINPAGSRTACELWGGFAARFRRDRCTGQRTGRTEFQRGDVYRCGASRTAVGGGRTWFQL